MKERTEETRFAWPDDGNAVNVCRDALAGVSMPELVDYVVPGLSGKAVIACWMLATGAEPQAVKQTLNVAEDTLRAYCGSILEAVQRHTGDTFILPEGGKP